MDVLSPYIAVMAIVSLICLAAFSFDKFLARRAIPERVPEIVLLTLIAFGGALGGFIGRNILRHKTNMSTKFHFAVVLYPSLIIQIGLIVVMLVVLL
jgi:uncharacterized membrane protein YsdA (DUF1294 family)